MCVPFDVSIDMMDSRRIVCIALMIPMVVMKSAV